MRLVMIGEIQRCPEMSGFLLCVSLELVEVSSKYLRGEQHNDGVHQASFRSKIPRSQKETPNEIFARIFDAKLPTQSP